MRISRPPVKHGDKLPEKLTGRGLRKFYNFVIYQYDEYVESYINLSFGF